MYRKPGAAVHTAPPRLANEATRQHPPALGPRDYPNLDATQARPLVSALMYVALRIEVRTLTGALRGVPALLRLLDEYGIQATFLFALGADRSAWTRWPLGHETLAERRRTAVLRPPHTPGSLLGLVPPAPLIGPRALEAMRSCRAAGHELGCLAHDPVAWERRAAHADPEWTRIELERALSAFDSLLGERPALFAAPSWQVNPHLFAEESRLGLGYVSDTRGRLPFLPLLQGVHGTCPQVPTTLPTLPELIGRDGVTVDNIHQFVFAESQYVAPQGHVFSAAAEIEGLRMLPVLERLLTMWRGSWGRVGPLAEIARGLETARLPTHQVGWTRVPGRGGYLAGQGIPVAL